MISSLGPQMRRCATSSLVRAFGSLKLAMALLAVLILACIVGTIAESRLDASIAHTYVYDAPWFIVWLLALCANLFCSVLARFPWKPRQAGFIITHAGIVVLLTGAMAGRIWGIEGHITLYKGGEPCGILTLNRTALEIKTEAMLRPSLHSIDLHLHSPT